MTHQKVVMQLHPVAHTVNNLRETGDVVRGICCKSAKNDRGLMLMYQQDPDSLLDYSPPHLYTLKTVFCAVH